MICAPSRTIFPLEYRVLHCARFPHQQTVGTSSITSAISIRRLEPGNRWFRKSVRRPQQRTDISQKSTISDNVSKEYVATYKEIEEDDSKDDESKKEDDSSSDSKKEESSDDKKEEQDASSDDTKKEENESSNDTQNVVNSQSQNNNIFIIGGIMIASLLIIVITVFTIRKHK